MGIGKRLKFLARSYMNHAKKKGYELFDQAGLDTLLDSEKEMELEEQVRRAVEKEMKEEEHARAQRDMHSGTRTSHRNRTSTKSRRAGQNSKRKSQKQQLAQHYANLELPPGAPVADVHKAWRKLILKYHPDRYAGDKAKIERATKITQIINSSYSALLEHLEGK